MGGLIEGLGGEEGGDGRLKTLEVVGDVAEGAGVAVDVESLDFALRNHMPVEDPAEAQDVGVFLFLFRELLKLLEEVFGEI